MTPIPMPTEGLLIVEDDHSFADWTRLTLRAHMTNLQVYVAHDLDSARALLRATPSSSWELVIVDLNLGSDDGVDLIEELTCDWPNLPVLVVTSVDSPSKALAAIRAGAQGYILKATVEADLIQVVNQVRFGGSPITPSIARQLLNEFRATKAPSLSADSGVPAVVLEKLSQREVEVLHLLSRGYSNKEAAAKMTISPATVDTHIRKIYRKLSINSRVELHRLLN